MDVESAAVDNDIVIKLVRYGLLDRIAEICPADARGIHILGLARFVVRQRLAKQDVGRPLHEMEEEFEQLRQIVVEIEPTSEEIELATKFEEAALRWNVDLDSGESQLCAVVITRVLALVVTGDKRAISALEDLIDNYGPIAPIAGKLACLEQLLLWLVNHGQCDDLRERVCADRSADRSITMCCACNAPACTLDDVRAGLTSYIGAVRSEAPRILTEYPDS